MIREVTFIDDDFARWQKHFLIWNLTKWSAAAARTTAKSLRFISEMVIARHTEQCSPQQW